MALQRYTKKNLLTGNEFITLKVKTAKLDDILSNKEIGFIKIDVEGHEKNVINGAVEIIRRNKPSLLVEIEERHSKTSVEETLNFINKLGYKSYFLSGTNLETTDKLNNYKDRILNIHPSLLPKYKGLNTHKRVIKNNEKFSGCTVHVVNSKLDSGKIILQKKIRILKKDDENSLSKRVLKIENLIYPKAIKKFIFSNL